jgi:predicted TIM-barrel fold metal-dependent hydrolase
MRVDLAEWLAQTPEVALDPERPIVDPHHHLWEYPGSVYQGEELVADTADHNIVKTVFVECDSRYREDGPEAMKPLGETEYVEGVAQKHSSPVQVAAGIVGFANMALGEYVQDVLEAHLELSPKRFRGIRHTSGWDQSDRVRNSHTNPPQGLMLDPSFKEGVTCLQKYNLSLDAWLYHPQLPDFVELARAFPNLPMILDHFAGPLGIGPYEGKGEEIFEFWKGQMDELVACENVTFKLGGLKMPICGNDWHKQDKPPTSQEIADITSKYHLYCIEKFGVDRCMFESNFPVDKVSCSYTVLWNAFKRIADNFSEDEKSALFHDTATRVYRLA